MFLKRWGAFLIVLGLGSLVLPMLGLQFRLIQLLGDRPGVGWTVAGVGLLLALLGAATGGSRRGAAPAPMQPGQPGPPPPMRAVPAFFDQMFGRSQCPQCGHAIRKKARFCPRCGASLAAPVAPVAPVMAPPMMPPPQVVVYQTQPPPVQVRHNAGCLAMFIVLVLVGVIALVYHTSHKSRSEPPKATEESAWPTIPSRPGEWTPPAPPLGPHHPASIESVFVSTNVVDSSGEPGVRIDALISTGSHSRLLAVAYLRDPWGNPIRAADSRYQSRDGMAVAHAVVRSTGTVDASMKESPTQEVSLFVPYRAFGAIGSARDSITAQVSLFDEQNNEVARDRTNMTSEMHFKP